ncbi:hypothetical protein NP603_21305 [Methylomonas sp. SURF-1]|uniref:Uncharacterized protein n=1 Tax=Methylomonas aurea TaxID=2952224 RepID=A0ABT1UN65_9GAMM|nr:hypothetical protein [Methylomonas sp. SURF-1]MCQ8183659.1 hypothetical protein [Methylomonas sp. SURF-1]
MKLQIAVPATGSPFEADVLYANLAWGNANFGRIQGHSLADGHQSGYYLDRKQRTVFALKCNISMVNVAGDPIS